MSEAKFTNGPWQLSGARMSQAPAIGKDTRLLSVGPDGDTLALVFFDMNTGAGHRDAYLIAAAPDNYHAAIDAMALLERMGMQSSDEYQALAYSTRKARGES